MKGAPNHMSKSTNDAKPLITPEQLDQTSSTPLYKQVADLIRTKIAGEQLVAGDRLPTEQRLSKDLGLGISTVRNAYALLVDEGIVTRRAGRGSFVSKPKLSRQLQSLYNFTEEVKAAGQVPTSQVLEFTMTKPDAAVAQQLGISQNDDVYVVKRLRCANGNPVLLETSSIPTKLCPGLTKEDVQGSLYESMTRLMGSAPIKAREVHEASTLSHEEARLLGRKPGAGTFRITRLTFNSRGETCEHCLVVAPGDQTRYTIELGVDGSSASKSLVM